MKLYHGTYTDNFVKIVEAGGYIITNNSADCIKDSATELLDMLILKYTGKDLRTGCIYLTDNNDATQAYDYAFTISIHDLDSDKLYVAENSILDEIIGLYYECKEECVLVSKINEYVNSYMPYDEYMAQEDCYYSPEYLYYDDIETEITDEDIEEASSILNEVI